jgi:hypothetical protein
MDNADRDSTSNLAPAAENAQDQEAKDRRRRQIADNKALHGERYKRNEDLRRSDDDLHRARLVETANLKDEGPNHYNRVSLYVYPGLKLYTVILSFPDGRDFAVFRRSRKIWAEDIYNKIIEGNFGDSILKSESDYRQAATDFWEQMDALRAEEKKRVDRAVSLSSALHYSRKPTKPLSQKLIEERLDTLHIPPFLGFLFAVYDVYLRREIDAK